MTSSEKLAVGKPSSDDPLPNPFSYKVIRETGNRKRETDTEGGGISRRKKIRTTFTGRQIFELERMFETKKYLNAGERGNLSRLVVIVINFSFAALFCSRLLSVTEQQVKIWFQNRRTKYKKMESGASNEQPAINDHFSAKLEHTDLKLARYESSLPDNMLQVNKSSNLHENDSLL
jgi:hypothetical protein